MCLCKSELRTIIKAGPAGTKEMLQAAMGAFDSYTASFTLPALTWWNIHLLNCDSKRLSCGICDLAFLWLQRCLLVKEAAQGALQLWKQQLTEIQIRPDELSVLGAEFTLNRSILLCVSRRSHLHQASRVICRDTMTGMPPKVKGKRLPLLILPQPEELRPCGKPLE